MSRGKIIGAIICLGAALLLFLVFNPSPRPAVAFPNPNGYDDILSATKVLVGEAPDPNSGTTTIEDYRTFVANNRQSLELVRSGLAKQCRMPTYGVDSPPVTAFLAPCKRLAFLLAAEGKIAEAETNFTRAADCYLDAIRLGQHIQRGGVLIEMLVGISCEAIGSNPLKELVPQLNAVQCREYTQALLQMDASRESFSNIIAEEKRFTDSVAFRYKFAAAAEWIKCVATRKTPSWERARQNSEKRWKAQLLRHQELLLALAVRAYELEKGVRPTNASDLVPEYLKSAPVDPTTGTVLKIPVAE